MTQYIINIDKPDTIYADFKYIATLDGYDGAPDADDPIGKGDTHREAIEELFEDDRFKFEGEE